MALNKSALKSSIKQLLQDMMSREDASYEEFATKLSDAIDDYVKTGTVKLNSGTVITTVGSATTQKYTTLGTELGTIS